VGVGYQYQWVNLWRGCSELQCAMHKLQDMVVLGAGHNWVRMQLWWSCIFTISLKIEANSGNQFICVVSVISTGSYM